MVQLSPVGFIGRLGRAARRGSGLPPDQLVANRTQIATLLQSTPANFTSRRSHWADPQAAISNFRTVDSAWYLNSSGNFAVADSFTIKRYIEYPAGTFTQVTWSGATSVTVTSGTNVKSDPIAVTIPAGTQFWERTVNLTSTVTNFPWVVTPANINTLGLTDGNDATDKGNSGTVAVSTGPNTFGCTAFVGAGNGVRRSFVIHGDSIPFGTGDVSSVTAQGGSGWVAAGLDPTYPSMKICLPGQQAQQITASYPAYASDFLTQIGYSDVIVTYGINDLRTGSRSQAQLLADLQTIYARFAGKRVWQTTLTPVTTGSWGDAASQAVSAAGTLSQRTSVNAAIRAIPSPLYGAIDAADFAETARDSGIWGSPYPCSTDGVHPGTQKARNASTGMGQNLPAAIALP